MWVVAALAVALALALAGFDAQSRERLLNHRVEPGVGYDRRRWGTTPGRGVANWAGASATSTARGTATPRTAPSLPCAPVGSATTWGDGTR